MVFMRIRSQLFIILYILSCKKALYLALTKNRKILNAINNLIAIKFHRVVTGR